MIYYTSDLHLYHERILENRPFDNLQQMHSAIAMSWIRKVGPYDTVYILGDVGMYHAREITQIISCLPGKKFLIKGNHDNGNLRDKHYKALFAGVNSYKEIKDNGRDVVLFHYPVEDWNLRREGAYHLHGHIHVGRDQVSVIPNRFNVGVEYNDYVPVTLDELIKRNKTFGQ